MPDIAAISPAQLMSGEGQNTRARFDGQLELTSKNRLANPRFDIFDSGENDDPLNVVLGAAPTPAGWGFYARQMGVDDHQTRQNLSVYPLGRSSHRQIGPLIDGPEPQDATRRGRIAPAFRPLVDVEDNARAGLRGDYVGVAYAWIAGSRGPGRRRGSVAVPVAGHTTAPSPRTIANPAEGQVVDVPLPDSAPEGVTAIVLYLTESQTSANAASIATLYEQRRFDITDGLRRTHTFTEFRRGREATENRTFAGSMNRLGPPDVKYVRSNRSLGAISTQLSWSFLTEFGLSEPQSATIEVGPPEPKRNTKLWWRPRNVPPTAIAWRPEVLASNGQWYALNMRPLHKAAAIHTNRIVEGRSSTGRFQSGSMDDQEIESVERDRYASVGDGSGDATGIASPDSALGDAAVKGRAQLDPSFYAIRGVWYEDDPVRRSVRETPPSPPVQVRTLTGETFRVHRPPAGNLIPNPHRVEIDRPTQLPEGWDKDDATAGLSVNLLGPKSGGVSVEVEDSSLSTGIEDVAFTPLFPIDPNEPSGYRVAIDVKRYVSGTAFAVMRCYDSSGAYLDGVGLGGANSLGETIITGNTAALTLPAGTVWARLALRVAGSSAAGARDLDFWSRTFGIAKGLIAPPEEGWRRLEDGDEDKKIPEGGACEIVENVYDRHPDLRGVQNFILRSRELSYSPWQRVGVDVADNVNAAPNGLMTADRISVSASAGLVPRLFQTRRAPGGSTFTFSCWLRQGSGVPPTARLVLTDESTGEVFAANPSITLDWSRPSITATFSAPVSNLTCRIDLNDSSGNAYPAGTVINAWGAQVVDSASPERYVRTLDTPKFLNEMNAVQYYGPYNTPAHAEHFLTDLTTPVRPGETTTFSVYGRYQGVSVPTDYLTTAYVDERGRTLQVNGPVVAGVSGTAAAQRYPQTSTAPEEAAYWTVIGGGGSDGYALFYAPQIESGAVVTAWEDAKAISGYRRLTFDSQLPGTATLAEDPSGFSSNYFPWLSAVRSWEEGGVVSTEPVGTSVSTRWRSTDNNPAVVAEPAYSEWFTSYDDVPKLRYQMLEVLMEGDTAQTPLVSWAGLSIIRHDGFLLRSDASEYDGGIRAVELSPTDPTRNESEFISDVNTYNTAVTGRFANWVQLSLGAHTMKAARQMQADRLRGDRHHVIEDPVTNQRLVVKLNKFEWGKPTAVWPRPRTEADPQHFLLWADDVKARIVSEERLF